MPKPKANHEPTTRGTVEHARVRRSFRFSPQTDQTLAALAERLTERDRAAGSVRAVTETEVLERAVLALARAEGLE